MIKKETIVNAAFSAQQRTRKECWCYWISISRCQEENQPVNAKNHLKKVLKGKR